MRARLGQHFLKNKEKIKRIIDALDIKNGDTIIEIGAGHGELTKELGIRNNDLGRIIGVEKDAELVRLLKEKFRTQKNIETIKGDALKLLPSLIHNSPFMIQNYKIVGNIPYYITGKLLRIISELEKKPKIAVLTVQKEVAERICAKPPKMNLLAASVQFWAEPEIVDFIPKKDFEPPPKVDSAIVKLESRNQNLESSNKYYKLIKALFKQPRKTILNNLIDGRGVDLKKIGAGAAKPNLSGLLEKIGIDPNNRPQDLTPAAIKKMSRLFYN